MFIDENRKVIGRLTVADIAEGVTILIMALAFCVILWRWG